MGQFAPSDLVRQAVDVEAAGFAAWFLVADEDEAALDGARKAAPERVREIEKMGPTVVCLQNASGSDPHAALQVYGEQVLPRLRGTRA